MVRRIPIPRDWRKENLGSKKRSQRKGENERDLCGTVKSQMDWPVGENWEVKQGMEGVGVQLEHGLQHLWRELTLYRTE